MHKGIVGCEGVVGRGAGRVDTYPDPRNQGRECKQK